MSEQTQCQCPEIDEADWHLKDMDWSGKSFYFVDALHFFTVPLGLEKRREELFAEISNKGYRVVNPELVLHQPGAFTGRLYVEIEDPEQYDANVIRFDDARILTRAHHSRGGSMKKSIDELKAFTVDRTHVLPGAVYVWHLTCPKCAQSRGGDKSILFARV